MIKESKCHRCFRVLAQCTHVPSSEGFQRGTLLYLECAMSCSYNEDGGMKRLKPPGVCKSACGSMTVTRMTYGNPIQCQVHVTLNAEPNLASIQVR